MVAHFLSEMVSQCLGMGRGHTQGSAALSVVTGDLIGSYFYTSLQLKNI